MSLLKGCNLLPQYHAMKTLLWQIKTQLCYDFQLFELKKITKNNNDGLVPQEKQGN